MKRCILTAVALLLLLPQGLPAQFRDPFPRARIAITPTLGYRIPYTTNVDATIYTLDEAVSTQFRERRGGGTLVGGELDVHVAGPVSLFGAVAYAEPADNWVAEEDGPEQRFIGPRIWYYSAGLHIRLPEPDPDYRLVPIITSILVAPALVREEPRPDPLPPEHPLYVPNPWDRIDHPALNLGVRATALLGTRHIALHLGIHDFVTFWNEREVERQLERAYREQLDLDVTADYNLRISHIFQGQLGLSFRF